MCYSAAMIIQAIINSGATHHMFPDHYAFKSYCPITGWWVCLANNSYTPVLVIGVAIFKLGMYTLLLKNYSHIPALCAPWS